MTPEQLQIPPTGTEVSDLILAANAVEVMGDIARRLAFQRDRLEAIVNKAIAYKVALRDWNHVCNRKHTPKEWGLAQANMQRRAVSLSDTLDTEIQRRFAQGAAEGGK